MLQTASVAGPALGGLVLATGGVGWVYVVNAVSFLFVIGALLMIGSAAARRDGGAAIAASSRSPPRSKGCASSSARR